MSSSWLKPQLLAQQELWHQFKIILQQESLVPYAISDYFATDWQDYLRHRELSVFPRNAGGRDNVQNGGDCDSAYLYNGTISIIREKICEWTYQVVDHFEIERSVAAVAISYLDRYLTRHSICSLEETCSVSGGAESCIQLIAVTCLYVAVKIHGNKVLRLGSVVALSRGYFKEADIVDMEWYLLNSLDWHLNSPTAFAYLPIFKGALDATTVKCAQLCSSAVPMSSSPEKMNAGIVANILELSQFLIELSVCDYFFAVKRPSIIAIASVICASDTLRICPKIRENIKEVLFSFLLLQNPMTAGVAGDVPKGPGGMSGSGKNISDIELCSIRLNQIYLLSIPNQDQAPGERVIHSTSPTSVLDSQ